MKDPDPFDSIMEIYDEDSTATYPPTNFADDITILKNHLDILIQTHNPTLTDPIDLQALKTCHIFQQSLSLYQDCQILKTGIN
jgi:hypothetical protein